MNAWVKRGVLAAAGLAAVVVAAVVVAVMVVDVDALKPRIESLVARQTGRPFSMGDDIHLSVFPWVGVSLSDLRLGNPDGFQAKEMVSVDRFEVRLKVMPLLAWNVEVKTFVLESPRIFLEKRKDGKTNWDDLAKTGGTKEKKTESPAGTGGDLPIESLLVGNFSIENGLVSYTDQAGGMTNKLADFNLNLSDISFDKPVGIRLSASLDGKPMALAGKVGPLGKAPGKTDISFDLALKALEQLDLDLAGVIKDPAKNPRVDIDLALAPFSPRKLVEALGRPFPVETADPAVLDKVALSAKLSGGPKAVSLTNGSLTLDDSAFTFTLAAKAFEKPDITLDIALDKMDLDRYLPPKADGKAAQAPGKSGQAAAGKTDYTPLRRLVLDAGFKAGELKAANMKIRNLTARLTGKNGVFSLDPLNLDLYQGNLSSTASLDVRTNTPKTGVKLNIRGVQAGPMIRDAAARDIIEGTVRAAVDLAMAGDTADAVKKSLKGSGDLVFKDGAIVGIDIADTVRSATSKVGLSKETDQKPRTDFAELKIPFTAANGVATVPGAALASPLMRVNAKGTAHLIKEELDFRVEPKLVATLKGQGDTKDRSGLMVPLLVTGPFASPKIRPDLKGLLGNAIPDTDQLKKMVDTKALPKVDVKSVEKEAKGLLKNLVPGLKN